MKLGTTAKPQDLDWNDEETSREWFWLFKERTVLLLIALVVTGMAIVWWQTTRLQAERLQSMSLETARAYSQALKEFRGVYVSEVVARVKAAGVEPLSDYEKKAKAIPTPSGFALKLGEAAEGRAAATQVRVYSADPSAEQQRTKPKEAGDHFAKEAWDALAQAPDRAFFRFENIRGRPSLRYATVWQDGESRGVLEIIQPVGSSPAQVSLEKDELVKLFGGIAAVGVLMLLVVIGRLRHSPEKSDEHTIALQVELSDLSMAQRELEKEIAERKRAEQEILSAVDILASATSDILTATNNLAASATEVAAAVNETTTTVEQVKQTAALSSQKAQQVSAVAHKAAQISQTGKKATEDTIGEMHRIHEQMQVITESTAKLGEQSQAIREIIDTVNDLAEQSNLLAVNASIEAQKAGAHGSGFVVVAQEVRSLAQQSKDATTQVQAILNDIEKATSEAVQITVQGAKAADTGMKQSVEAGESIRSLARSVEEAAQSATLIATSNQQQAIGMDQLVQAMLNIQEGSMQTVTSTKQVEANAQKLHELGQRLQAISVRLSNAPGSKSPASVPLRVAA